MNHYDELGVSPRASFEEIKEAYRLLVRLLHPDHQSDPELQRVAEQEMKRLNQAYSTLMDPEKRRRYDLELSEARQREIPIIVHAPPIARKRFTPNSLAWVGAAVLFGGMLIWMASRESSGGPSDRHDTDISAATSPEFGARPTEKNDSKPPLGEVSALMRAELRQALIERDAALQEVVRLKAAALIPERSVDVPRQRQSKVTEVKAPDQPATRQIAVQQSAPVPSSQAQSSPLLAKASPPQAAPQLAPMPAAPDIRPQNPLLGTWVYRKPNTPRKNKELYPPEFIETVITEENGEVRGRYRARYEVLDRPISPDINFQFEGKLSGDSANLPWSGAGGAKGEVVLKLMSDHSLKVDWVASQLGAFGFYKGTAVLVKQSD